MWESRGCRWRSRWVLTVISLLPMWICRVRHRAALAYCCDVRNQLTNWRKKITDFPRRKLECAKTTRYAFDGPNVVNKESNTTKLSNSLKTMGISRMPSVSQSNWRTAKNIFEANNASLIDFADSSVWCGKLFVFLQLVNCVSLFYQARFNGSVLLREYYSWEGHSDGVESAPSLKSLSADNAKCPVDVQMPRRSPRGIGFCFDIRNQFRS